MPRVDPKPGFQGQISLVHASPTMLVRLLMGHRDPPFVTTLSSCRTRWVSRCVVPLVLRWSMPSHSSELGSIPLCCVSVQ